jgi:hypothetical protein
MPESFELSDLKMGFPDCLHWTKLAKRKRKRSIRFKMRVIIGRKCNKELKGIDNFVVGTNAIRPSAVIGRMLFVLS